MSAASRRLRRGLTAAAGLALAWALAETALFALDPLLSWGAFQYHPEIGFRVPPFFGGANRFGFNAPDYPLERSPGVRRVLVLGDSFNWMYGREGNYTALLERKLNAAFGKHRVDVIGAGYPMAHPGHHLRTLRAYGLQYDLDLVVLGIFAGNDFYDAQPYRKMIVLNGLFFDIDERSERHWRGRPLLPRSRVWAFLAQSLELLSGKLAARLDAGRDRPAGAEEPQFSERRFLQAESQQLEFFDRGRQRAGEFEPHVGLVLASLSEIKKLLDARGIRLAVAVYPDQFQVYDETLARVCAFRGRRREDFDMALPQDILSRFCRSRGIPFIDLLPEFRAQAGARRLYRWRDTHWNREGNELAAEILAKRLRPLVRP